MVDVKFYTFPAIVINGSVISKIFTDYSINGRIERFTYVGITSPGSLWLAESGTNVEICRKNDIVSGTANGDIYPRKQITDTNSVGIGAGSGNVWTEPVVNSPLYIAGSGFTSGTGTLFGPITMYYV